MRANAGEQCLLEKENRQMSRTSLSFRVQEGESVREVLSAPEIEFNLMKVGHEYERTFFTLI